VRERSGRPAAPSFSPAATEAIQFLKVLDPTGRHNLVAFDPDVDHGPPIAAHSFVEGDWSGIAAFVEKHTGKANLYFSANEPAADAPNAKLQKRHIGRLRAVYADVDPADGVELDHARATIAAQAESLNAGALPPSAVVDTGGGFQYLWRLTEKLDPTQFMPWAEGQGRALAQELGGDAVQNIDRLLRLPGSPNIPTPSKRDKGRVKRLARIVSIDPSRVYSPTALSNVIAPVAHISSAAEETDRHIAAAREAIDFADVETHTSFDDLDPALRAKFEKACEDHPALRRLYDGDPSARIGDLTDVSSSAWRMSLAHMLGSIGGFTAHEYARMAWVWPHISDHQHRMDERQLAKDWGKFGAPAVEYRQSLIERFFENIPLPASSWIDPREWTGQKPAVREWEVQGWIPRGEVTLLYGDGGIGKTLLAHQYATAAATGKAWLGQKTRPARVMCFFCEDSADELHRRQIDINAALGVEHADLGNLRLASRKHDENALGVWDDKAGKMKTTDEWKRLRADAVAFGADVIVVDTLSDVFVGNEVQRAQANAFVKQCLGRLAHAIGGSVIALGHPSVAGKNSGEGTSGSTGWSNAVRSRLYLRYPDKVDSGNIRELAGMKLNYGPKGSLLKIKWERGAFVVLAGRTPAADPGDWPAPVVPKLDDAAESAVLAALVECAGVRMSTAKNSQHFAPRVIKRRTNTLDAYSEAEVDAALTRLERGGLIKMDEVGRDASRHVISGYVVQMDKLSASQMQTDSVFE
jgi:hypothetical protein